MARKGNKSWHAITVTGPKEGSDWISHILIELGSLGNIEETAPDPQMVALKGYFPTELGSDMAITQSILHLLEERGIKPLSLYSATIKIQNWAHEARQMFEPIKILPDLTIINPWTRYRSKKGETAVVINPGMAFGTGYHATTQLAAKLSTKIIAGQKIKSMCDVGSGSAILSIIASKKGVGKIAAVEIDTDARTAAQENIKENRAGRNIKVYECLREVRGKFDLVVANILYATIVEMKKELVQIVKKNGFLVFSGVTKEEDEKFKKSFKKSTAVLVEAEEKDGWMGYIYQCRNSSSKKK